MNPVQDMKDFYTFAERMKRVLLFSLSLCLFAASMHAQLSVDFEEGEGELIRDPESDIIVSIFGGGSSSLKSGNAASGQRFLSFEPREMDSELRVLSSTERIRENVQSLAFSLRMRDDDSRSFSVTVREETFQLFRLEEGVGVSFNDDYTRKYKYDFNEFNEWIDIEVIFDDANRKYYLVLFDAVILAGSQSDEKARESSSDVLAISGGRMDIDAITINSTAEAVVDKFARVAGSANSDFRMDKDSKLKRGSSYLNNINAKKITSMVERARDNNSRRLRSEESSGSKNRLQSISQRLENIRETSIVAFVLKQQGDTELAIHEGNRAIELIRELELNYFDTISDQEKIEMTLLSAKIAEKILFNNNLAISAYEKALIIDANNELARMGVERLDMR